MADSKYINGGKELVVIKDRKAIGSAHRRSTRWIVWSETQQQALSQHATRKAAQESLDSMR